MKFILRIFLIANIFIVAAAGRSSNPWPGRWEWSECWRALSGENNCVNHVLNISRQDEKLIVNIDIDGYMSLFRIKSEGKYTQNGIQVVYLGIREDNKGSEYFKKGDVLFELKSVKKDIDILERVKTGT